MRRVLICGDRHWTNFQRILQCVQKAHKTETIDVIIEGECRGADRMGHLAANAEGIEVLSFPAQWDKYQRGKGNPAGPIRNQQMLDEGKPTEVWAFHNSFASSIGTKDMVNRSIKAGLPVYLISESGWIKTQRETLDQPALFHVSNNS